MRLSIFTTVTDPSFRGDNYQDAIECYNDLADEVVVVDGTLSRGVITKYDNQILSPWPQEFSWEFIGQQFQRGYEACTGDVVIHADLDFLFHENDFKAIREACENMLNSDAPALTFYKYQFILPDRYNIKSRLVVAVNKAAYGNRIRFDSGGDLCQPSLDGQYIRPESVPEARVPIYNYECLLKTKKQLLEDKGRMARAWQRQFGEYKLGGPDDESAYDKWLTMVVGRHHKPNRKIKLSEHPKYIQETIKNLKPDQWGYSGFGLINV